MSWVIGHYIFSFHYFVIMLVTYFQVLVPCTADDNNYSHRTTPHRHRSPANVTTYCQVCFKTFINCFQRTNHFCHCFQILATTTTDDDSTARRRVSNLRYFLFLLYIYLLLFTYKQITPTKWNARVPATLCIQNGIQDDASGQREQGGTMAGGSRRVDLSQVCFFIFYFTLLTYCIQLSPPFQYPTKTTVGFGILLLMNGYFTGFCRVRPPPSTQMQQQQQQGLKSFYFSNSMYVYFYIIITY